MRKKFNILIIIASLLLGVESYGQSNYYYYKGEKIPLSLDSKNLTLLTSDDFQFQPNSSQNIEKIDYLSQNKMDKTKKLKYIQLKLKNNITPEALSQLKKNSKIKQVIPNFITSIGKGVGMSDYFYVKLKDINDYEKLVQVAEQYKSKIIEQNKFMPLWFTLKCTEETKENTLEVANSFFESELFSSATPDFLHDDLFCANDDDFNQLWGLNNSQNPNIDINICDAWNITEGNGVNVAVLDQGIELNHNDLQNNISQNSYDTESNSSPSQIFGNHGTHVAGTIAAIKNNNLQVVGVAPQATLLSVRNSLAGTPNSRIRRADGINWAWQNGADIISNSWGSAVQYDVIDDAIDNALTNGRNGLGTIIVFATGNDFGAVAYPANSNPNILSVGSITSTGVRSNFSNFGNQLDVVAPGSGILSTVNNNGTATFDGTSMATPHVSGVAALILSVNPNLTFQQVNNIIESTAQKVGTYNYTNTAGRPNGTWDDEMGYGLVDAFAAVQQAQQTLWVGPPEITTNSYTTPSGPGNNPSYICVYLDLIGDNNTSIANQGITNVTWTEIYSSGQCYSGFSGSNFNGNACGTCENWLCQVKITATNSFGSTTIYRTLAPPRREPSKSSYRISSTSKDIYEISQITESLESNILNSQKISNANNIVSIYVFNHYGIKVMESNKSRINISNLENGIYFIKAYINTDLITHKIIKK